MGDLTPAQRTAMTSLLQAALSADGYRKVTEIMRGDEMLRTNGDGRGRGPGGGPNGPPRGGAPGGPPGAGPQGAAPGDRRPQTLGAVAAVVVPEAEVQTSVRTSTTSRSSERRRPPHRGCCSSVAITSRSTSRSPAVRRRWLPVSPRRSPQPTRSRAGRFVRWARRTTKALP